MLASVVPWVVCLLACRTGANAPPFATPEELCDYLAMSERECGDDCVRVACPHVYLQDRSGQGACPEADHVVITSQERLSSANTACGRGWWEQWTCVDDDTASSVAPSFDWVVYCTAGGETD